MKIISTIAAGFVCGLLLSSLAYLVVPAASVFALWFGWPVFSLLFYQNVDTSKIIWARACLIASVECLAIPTATWLIPLFLSQPAVLTFDQNTCQTAKELWSLYQDKLSDLLSGSAGILVGLILLFSAYYSLRPARRK